MDISCNHKNGICLCDYELSKIYILILYCLSLAKQLATSNEHQSKDSQTVSNTIIELYLTLVYIVGVCLPIEYNFSIVFGTLIL